MEKNPKKANRALVASPTKGMLWPWSLGMTEYESIEQRLHDEIVAYNAYISPTIQETYARSQLIARIGEVVQGRYPYCTLKTFGSTAHDLYLPDGDIDMCVNTPHEADHPAKVKMLDALSVALRESQLTKSTFVIRRARVPLVSFQTITELGSYKCDISINSEGLRGVSVIAEYLHSMPALRYIVFVVKSYLARIQLGSPATAGLGSYSTILLTINYIQLNPKGFPEDDLTKPLEKESLGRLLLGFFEYYGYNFDYANSVVSVLSKALLTKEDKGWVRRQPDDRLSIEDPTNPENDVGKPTSKIVQVRDAFCDAYNLLREYPVSMTHNNALGTIIGISPEVAKRRADIRKLVDSGALDSALRRIKVQHPHEADRARHRLESRHSLAPYPSQPYRRAPRSHPTDHRGANRPPPPHLERRSYAPRPLTPPMRPPSVCPPAPPTPTYSSAPHRLPSPALYPVRSSAPYPDNPPAYSHSQLPIPSYARPPMPPTATSYTASGSYGYEYERQYDRDYRDAETGRYSHGYGTTRSQVQGDQPRRKHW